jgi:glutamine synthetase
MHIAKEHLDVAAFKQAAAQYLVNHPDTERLELLFVDLNGILRGKWLPVSSLLKLAEGAFRLPRSVCYADIWSDDVTQLGLGIQVGDPDGICLPLVETLAPVPWAKVPTAQMMLTMLDQDDMQPCQYAPRVVLEKQLSALKAQGFTPVVATELEFYFIDPQLDKSQPQRPLNADGRRLDEDQQYSMELLEQFEEVLQDILSTAAIQNLPVDTTISECGPGQFEINLLHQNDALLAADQAILLKRTIKQVARKHHLRASFMPKPYAVEMGNGMHVHASLNNAQGDNIFASENEQIHPLLAKSVAGLLHSMTDTQLIYAPHANSYRRFIPGCFAPVSPCWGYDHRAAAVRVPAILGAPARLEHRVSGADANPYLVIAAVLAGMRYGLNEPLTLAEPLNNKTDLTQLTPMTRHWAIAIEQLQNSQFMTNYFGAEFKRVYSGIKSSEELIFANTITAFECDTYLLKV